MKNCITFTERGSDGQFPVRIGNESNMDVINEVFGALSTTAITPPSTGYTYLPVEQTPLDVRIAYYYNPHRIYTSLVDVSAYQVMFLFNYRCFFALQFPFFFLECTERTRRVLFIAVTR